MLQSKFREYGYPCFRGRIPRSHLRSHCPLVDKDVLWKRRRRVMSYTTAGHRFGTRAVQILTSKKGEVDEYREVGLRDATKGFRI